MAIVAQPPRPLALALWGLALVLAWLLTSCVTVDRRTVSAATKARYVAESILLHEAEGHAWSVHQFGLDVESAQWQLVLTALATLRAAQAAQRAA